MKFFDSLRSKRSAPLVVKEAGTPWCYDTLLDSVRDAWDVHDKTCESLPWFWLGRRGGVSCPSDWWTCHGCDVYFSIDGVPWVNYPDEDERRLCACCAKREGYVVTKVDEFGVHAALPPSSVDEGNTPDGI